MANQSEIKDVINEILIDTFGRLRYAYTYNNENGESLENRKDDIIVTRLIFPKYRDEEKKNKKELTRVSEQELRFAFIESFVEKCTKEEIKDLFYSIETPTQKKYSFSKKPKEDEEEGRSAEFDTVIFKKNGNTLDRVCLIEFKAHNPNAREIEKDLLKLSIDVQNEDVIRYFIFLIKSADEEKTLNYYDTEKRKSIATKIKTTSFADKPICVCYNIESNRIFIYDKSVESFLETKLKK